MEQVQETPKKERYKKIGGGSFRMGNRIIKPGQVFEAYPFDIPETVHDLVVLADGGVTIWPQNKEKIIVEKIDGAKPVYTTRQRENTEWWDIFDLNGKKINEKGLPKEAAEKLIQNLMA